MISDAMSLMRPPVMSCYEMNRSVNLLSSYCNWKLIFLWIIYTSGTCSSYSDWWFIFIFSWPHTVSNYHICRFLWSWFRSEQPLNESATFDWKWVLHSLQWRHNEHDGVSNHQPHDCLLNRLFWCRSKKIPKLRANGLSAGNSAGAGEFPAQMASNTDSISIWWRHHVLIEDGSTVISANVYLYTSREWIKLCLTLYCDKNMNCHAPSHN